MYRARLGRVVKLCVGGTVYRMITSDILILSFIRTAIEYKSPLSPLQVDGPENYLHTLTEVVCVFVNGIFMLVHL